MTNPEPGFEIEVPSVEEFLKLLKEREEEGGKQEGNRATRKAVFVAQMMDWRPSNYGFPLIRRYVVAAFAYGRDRVSYTRTTSNAVELSETGDQDRRPTARSLRNDAARDRTRTGRAEPPSTRTRRFPALSRRQRTRQVRRAKWDT